MKLNLLRDFFFNRTDFVANLAPWSKPCPVRVRDEQELALLLRAHLGEIRYQAMHATSSGDKGIHPIHRVGSYVPSPDNTTRWLCIDFDGKGHASALRSPLGTAQLAIGAAKKLGVPAYLEQSGGGRGWHVWVFFDVPMPALIARRLGLTLAPHEAPLIGGGSADVFTHKGIEVFPKIVEVNSESSGKGHLVWLPWWGGAPDEASEFFDHDASAPMAIETFDVARMLDVTALELVPLERSAPRAPVVSTPYEHADDWEAFKKQVIERIDLHRVFRLTGKKAGRGWLQARDYGVEDRDPSAAVSTGEVADRALFHSYRSGETLDLFSYLQAAHGAHNFIEAAKLASDWTGIKLPEVRKPGREPEAETEIEVDPAAERESEPSKTNDHRTRVDVKQDELGSILMAWEAINAVPLREQRIFHWGGVPVSVKSGRTHHLRKGLMRAELAKRVFWFKHGPQTEEFAPKPAAPNDSLVSAILESAVDNAHELVSIVRAPVFVSGGRLLTEPGYDAQAKIYHAKTCDVPELPKTIESDHLFRAHELIFGYLLKDFPFDTIASSAHAVAAMLNPFVRHLIDGPTPLYLFEAPTQASGKTLLASIVAKIFSGYAAPLTLSNNNEEENRKSIFSSVMQNPGGVVFIDNLKGHLESPFIEAMMTSEMIEQRVLGASQVAYALNRTTFLLTSNNPSMSADLHRRALSIRIDPAMSRPEFRDTKSFRIPHLARWVRENRGELIWSLLVLVRYWLQQGAVRAPHTMGSFEDFAAVMGGILQVNGISGFLEGRSTTQSEEFVEWQSFLSAWYERWDDSPVSVGLIYRVLLSTDEFADFFAGPMSRTNSEKGRVSTLGRLLKMKRGVRFGEYYVTQDGRKWMCRKERDGENDLPF